MRTALLLAFLAIPACVQEKKGGVDRAEMHRFLYFAVYEGLWEDGADAALIRSLRVKQDEHFVVKCYICNAVRHAFDAYAAAPNALFGDMGKGTGLPKEIHDDLKDAKRETRLRGLERLVERYISRRYERLRMTEEEKAAMKARLEEERKFAMSVKENSFGEFCPSCEGAVQRKKK